MQRGFVFLVIALSTAAQSVHADKAQKTVTLASTTSTEQSGLFQYLLPQFTAQTGIVVRVVAVGTGQAIDLIRRGDADLALVHDTAAEQALVDQGFAVGRANVMYNDFVFVGPSHDPAKTVGSTTSQAFMLVAATDYAFVSRGDRSGTHNAELRLWAIKSPEKKPGFSQYRECGCSMGAALNIASALNAYLLADRATWAAFKNRGQLTELIQGQVDLKNQYGVLLANPKKHPHTNYSAAMQLQDWLLSKKGQQTIEQFKINGQSVFFPNSAVKP
jgi:tungstate transport system substrate-binding protein